MRQSSRSSRSACVFATVLAGCGAPEVADELAKPTEAEAQPRAASMDSGIDPRAGSCALQVSPGPYSSVPAGGCTTIQIYAPCGILEYGTESYSPVRLQAWGADSQRAFATFCDSGERRNVFNPGIGRLHVKKTNNGAWKYAETTLYW